MNYREFALMMRDRIEESSDDVGDKELIALFDMLEEIDKMRREFRFRFRAWRHMQTKVRNAMPDFAEVKKAKP